MWITESNRRLFFDMHFPDWEETDIAQNFNPVEIAERFAKSHIDSAMIYAKCQYGNFYYDTKLGHKHSGLGDQDLYNELRVALQERDVKVIAYYSVAWDEWYGERHPEWLVQKSDGTSDTEEFRWKTLCINSPYRQVVLDHFKEMMEIAKPDAFWIDMTIIGKDRCHCPYCQAEFKKRYGVAIPKNEEDPAYHAFMQFRYDYIEEFYGELRHLVKSMDDNVIVTNNYWGYPYSNATMGSRAIGANKHADFVTGEAYTDWTGLNAPSFFSKFLRGVAGGRPYEALIGRFYNTWDYTAKPFPQLAFEAYSTVANGACVTIDDEPYHDGQIDRDLYEDIEKIYGEIKRREKYLGGEVERYAAVFHSQASKDYFHHYGNEAFIKSMAGSYKMLRDLHLPVDFIFDDAFDQEKLKDYKVIILPCVAIITHEIMKALKVYVEQGGCLVTTGVTALYTMEGGYLVKQDNLMKEYFGIDAREGDFSISYMKPDKEWQQQWKQKERPILVKGSYLQCEGMDQVYSWLVEPICETSKERFFHNNLPAPYKERKLPAVATKSCGRGQVIVFAQPVLSHYAKQSQWDLRQVFQGVLQANIQGPRVQFDCPHRMDVAVETKNNQLILHLLNPNPGMSVCCGYLDPFEGAYPRTFEYMDEILPVYDVKVIIKANQLKEGKDIVKAIGEATSLEVEQQGDDSIIRVGKVDLWQTLVIDLYQI